MNPKLLKPCIRNYTFLLGFVVSSFLLSAATNKVEQGTLSIFDEIGEVNERAGGIYYAYPFSDDVMPEIPEGYEPFYISHYGRHGSRWVINTGIYDIIRKAFEREAQRGNLTPEGEMMAAVAERCGRHAEGHSGELSPLGERQHRGIAERLMGRFPSLFTPDSKIEARSSMEPRCIISMAAFCERLKELNPGLSIQRHATPSDMKWVNFSTPEAKALGNDSAVWMKEFTGMRDSLTISAITASRLFKQPELVDSLPRVMRAVFDMAIDVQDVDDIEDNPLGMFASEDLYNQWKASNYMMYVRHGDSPEGDGAGPQSAKNLVKDIIERANTAIGGNGNDVDLRFGHDTALIRFLSFIGAEGASGRFNGIEEISNNWQTYRLSPMGANFQLIFFRNKEGKIIVLPRLNERPIKITLFPESTAAPGFYDWQTDNN